MTTFLTLAEVPQTTKDRVVEIVMAFDGEPFGVGVAAAGLSAFGFAKNHPELNLDADNGDQVLPLKRQIAYEEFGPNREAYENLVLQVLEEAAKAEFENLLQDVVTQALGPQAAAEIFGGSGTPTDGCNTTEAPATPQAVTGDNQANVTNIEEQADNFVPTTEAPKTTPVRHPCGGF